VSGAQRGWRVTLLERQGQLGGQVRLAATVPNRAELGDLVRNLAGEARRRGVDIQLGTEAAADRVEMLAPDAVVVATGAVPQRPWWAPPPDGGGERICDVVDVLTGAAAPTGSVVVIDDIGFHHATSVAELLADRGCRVEIVTKSMVVGQDLGITLDMESWWFRASAKGIVQTIDRVAMGYDAGTLTLLHHPTGADDTRTPDWVVLAVPPSPVEWLYHDVKAAGVRVQRVGDCVAPRRAHAAVVDDFRNRNKDRRFVLVSSATAEDGVSVIAAVSSSLTGAVKAPEIMKELGLRGGGRPDFAQGGGVAAGDVAALRARAAELLKALVEKAPRA